MELLSCSNLTAPYGFLAFSVQTLSLSIFHLLLPPPFILHRLEQGGPALLDFGTSSLVFLVELLQVLQVMLFGEKSLLVQFGRQSLMTPSESIFKGASSFRLFNFVQLKLALRGHQLCVPLFRE
mmetsp:Transcript_35044/g.79918  ORF Transcript_35044/g.79918 Transcript_35044/m.79918 type:complete len:124 (-) Transcript_35044:149-520(-)